MNIFGFRLIKQSEWDAKNSELKRKLEEILKLNAENERLNNVKISKRPFIETDLGDPEPTDSEKRRLYVAAAAGFHVSHLKPKLLKMISSVRAQLEQFDSNKDAKGNPMTNFSGEDFDKILKGTINALWLIFDWGESMINEQIANSTELSAEARETLKELTK